MNRSRGFTLVELLIVVAIIGIITAVAVPSLMSAVDRSRGKGTMMDMKQMSVAIESYALDHVRYPEVGSLSSLEDVAASLPQYIEGNYVEKVKANDAWGHSFKYGSDGEKYTFRSYGKDGKPTNATGGATADVKADIIMVNGTFLQYHKGQSATAK